jgi:hypothetical protein
MLKSDNMSQKAWLWNYNLQLMNLFAPDYRNPAWILKKWERFADQLYSTSFSTESIQASDLIAYQIHKTGYTSKG